MNLSLFTLLAIGFTLGCRGRSEDRAADKAVDLFKQRRDLMVAEQLATPARGITDDRVLQAMREVPRHEFVPPTEREAAYQDRPLPIGFGQTISQPYIVAFMTEQLAPRPADRVLEVGTGSGYQAAVLARLVSEVYTIEIVEALGQSAGQDFARLGYTNIFVRLGDGYQGWPEKAPFDSIIVTCAPDHVPQPLVDQLKEGGRLIIPVGKGTQELVLMKKAAGSVTQQAVLPVRFVPMTGQAERP